MPEYPTWVEAYKQMQTAMTQQNGKTPAGYPRISNEQAASVLRYIMRTATRSNLRDDLTAQWYPVALAAAGWQKPGDKFILEPMPGAAEHRKAFLSDAATPVLWTIALNVATHMQDRNVPFEIPTLDPHVDYKEMLKQAWARMQRENQDGSTPASEPPSSTKLPDPTPPKAPPPKSSGGNGWLILLGILLLSKGRL